VKEISYSQPVLRIRIRDPDLESGMGKKILFRDLGRTSHIIFPRAWKQKYLNSLMWIRIRDPESILPGIRDKHPGSATLLSV